ncbi:MAG: serine hydrolase domain-containing protein [Chitinophagaceae bacterium]|jgi:D-alanyl-D-alanine carboxypeptidase
MNNKTPKITLVMLCILTCMFSYAQNPEQSFQQVLDSIYQVNKDAVGIMIHVEAPDKKISWSSAAGFSNKLSGEKINKDQPALIASNTKTYVAAAILKLIESKTLQLDCPVRNLLYRKTRKRLEKSGYDLNHITVKDLLSHTSGITDYVTDDYFSFVDQHPQYQWTRDEQIDWAMKVAKPVEAKKKFSYADINYLLLTEIIELKTNKPFYRAIKDLLDYNAHHINNTWFIDLEPKPTSLPLVHQYSDKFKGDTYDLNTSWDLYGGGGIASTTKDLALFFQALFEGKIVKDKNILDTMYAYVLPKEASNYCLGIRRLNFFGHTAYYHGGFWGTDAMYIPEYNATIVIFTLVREKRDLSPQLANKIIDVLK